MSGPAPAPVTEPTPPLAPTAPADPTAAPAPPAAGAAHPVAPVFSTTAFLLALVGLVAAATGAPLLQALLVGRGGLPPSLATAGAVVVAFLVAATCGAVAALWTRRIGFYEVTAAMLLWAGSVGLRVAALGSGRWGRGPAWRGWSSRGCWWWCLACSAPARWRPPPSSWAPPWPTCSAAPGGSTSRRRSSSTWRGATSS